MVKKKKIVKRAFAVVFILVTLVAFAVPSFAGSVNSDAQQVVVDTGVVLTGYGQTSVGNIRPIAQLVMGFNFSVDNNKFYVKAYPASGDHLSLQYLKTAECVFSTGVQNSLDVIPNYLALEADCGMDIPILYPYGYWRTYNGTDGNVYDEYNPSSTEPFELATSSVANSKFGLRAWTSSSASDAEKCIHLDSYQVTYTPAIWSKVDNINLGDKGALNSENAIYNALRVGGYTTLVLNFSSRYADEGDTTTCTKYVQWIGYQGDVAFSNTYYTGSAGGGAVSDTDASYQLGYEAGKASVEQDIADRVANAYQDGYDAGSVNSGLIPAALLSIGEIPFNIIHDFLDFEIFGFNISSLVVLVVSGGAFIWILKFLL